MNDILFAQIREDLIVEKHVSHLYDPKRILCIGSGGCTALSLLTDNVEYVYAVDVNPTQCALIELRRHAISILSRDEYLQFIGILASNTRNDIYDQLASLLTPTTRNYWDRNRQYIEGGINNCGVTERFYRYVSDMIRGFVYGDEIWNHLLSISDLDEQRAFHQKFFTTMQWKSSVRILLSKHAHMLFYPAQIFNNSTTTSFGDYFLDRFDHELSVRLVRDNYFLTQLLYERYVPDSSIGLPYYMTPAGYEEIKRNISKLQIVCAPLQILPLDITDINAYYISNVFDWCDPVQTISIYNSLVGRAHPSAIVLFRKMLDRLDTLNVLNIVQDDYEKHLSKFLTDMDRSMMYHNISCIHI